ncbi:MAG: hypothetical protein AVDCRST_MAG49-451, partial [uncultured Thermomicrobiales bacterium]
VVRCHHERAAAGRRARGDAQAHRAPAQRLLDPRTGDRAGAHRDPGRRRVGLAHAPRRGGRVHHRRDGGDDDPGAAHPHPARRRPLPDAAPHAAQRAGRRSRDGPDALHLHRRGGPAPGGVHRL